MNRKIEKKILPEYFDNVLKGEKTFEIRKDEDGVKPGDSVVLKEWDGERFTGRCAECIVTYVLRNVEQYGLMTGYCIFSFRIVKFVVNETEDKDDV